MAFVVISVASKEVLQTLGLAFLANSIFVMDVIRKKTTRSLCIRTTLTL